MPGLSQTGPTPQLGVIAGEESGGRKSSSSSLLSTVDDSISLGESRRVVTRSLSDDEFLTVAEIAMMLKLHQQTVRNWIAAGNLPAYRVGRALRVRSSALERFVSEGQVRAAASRGPLGCRSAPVSTGGERPKSALTSSEAGGLAARRRCASSLNVGVTTAEP